MAKKRKKQGKKPAEVTAPAETAGAMTDPAEVPAVVRTLADPICHVEGMDLIHVEYQREMGGRVLRLYVDKPGGVTLGDCQALSAQLGDILDLKLDTPEAYTLEVSSPGVDRPVSRLADFEKFTGALSKLKTATPINGQKNFRGILSGIVGEESDVKIQIKTETDTIAIPFQDIMKARLVNYDGDNKCL
ncbi:MAG: ribosome maturation factor RimP [Desulfobacterales bacterium]